MPAALVQRKALDGAAITGEDAAVPAYPDGCRPESVGADWEEILHQRLLGPAKGVNAIARCHAEASDHGVVTDGHSAA
jgi:hypothetical protein